MSSSETVFLMLLTVFNVLSSPDSTPETPSMNASSELNIVWNPYLNEHILAAQIPEYAETMQLASLMSYRIIFDSNATETQQAELINTLHDAIVHVLDMNGYG